MTTRQKTSPSKKIAPKKHHSISHLLNLNKKPLKIQFSENEVQNFSTNKIQK
jgi:hypothetical protein